MEKFTISQLYTGHTIEEIEDTFKVVEDIINNLDEYALNELGEGYSWDIDKFFLDVVEESNKLINSGGGIQSFTYNYLDHLTDQLDEYLRNISLAYFVSNCIPDFNIEPYHLEWFNLIQLYRFLCVLAARGHSKSFCFSFCYPLWKAYRYKGQGKEGKEILLISSEETLSEELIKIMEDQIRTNSILKERLYPNSSKGSLAKSFMETKNGFYLIGKGITSNVRGFHCDVICDDMLDESNFYNSSIRQSTIDFFNSSIMNIPLPKTGKATVIGTPFHEQDLYGYLKNAKNWRVFEYPGIYPDGTLLSPERFSLQELLDKKAQIGSIAFSREILMKPISSNTSLFPKKILKMNLVDTVSMANNKFNIPFKYDKIVFGVDLAISANTDETSDADYFCVAIIAFDSSLKRYWIVNLYRERGLSYLKQINVVKQLNERFEPDLIMVESNQYQQAFADMLRNEGLTNVADRKTTSKNKYSFQIGLPAISVLFEQFRLKIPYQNDIYTRNLAEIIMAEFNSMTFNNNKLQSTQLHDDTCMAIWLGVTGINYINNDLVVSFVNY